MKRIHSYSNSYGIGLALFLSGCFGGPGFLKQNEAYEAQDAAISMVTSGEVTSGAISAAAVVTQTLTAPTSSSISGVKVSVPPGTLSIDTTIHLEESAPLATGVMSQTLGITLSATAGRAVSISADKVGTSELSRPMTLAIPLNMSLWLTGEERSLVIVYRTYKDGEVFDGVIPPNKVTVVGNEVRFDIVRWGAYQPAYIPKAEEQKAVAVVEQKTEEKIITKTEQKKFPEPKLSALTINYDSKTYIATMEATLQNAEAEKCYIEAYGIENGQRDFEWTTTPLKFEVDFSQDPHRIYVKVRMGCYLKNSGLLVETTYSTLDVPADSNRSKPNSGGQNPCPSGNCPPNIERITLSASSLDFSGGAEELTLDVTVEISANYTMDINSSPNDDQCWMFYNPYGSTPLHACDPIQPLGSNKYSRKVRVHKWTKAEDKYYLWHLDWKDTAGNKHVLTAGEMRANQSAPATYQSSTLALQGFSVTNTATDVTPPTLSAVYFYSELSPYFTLTTYDSAVTPDEASGISIQFCYEVVHDTTQTHYFTCVTPTGSSMWTATLNMSLLKESGNYSIIEFSVSDRAQNRRVYRRVNETDSMYSDISGGTSTPTGTVIFTFTK